jgi:hypothetical protein
MSSANHVNDLQGKAKRTLGNRSGQARAREVNWEKVSQNRLLGCLEGCCSLVKAARAARVSRSAHYRWMTDDPTYPPRFHAAMQKAIVAIQDHAVRLAYEGVKRPIMYKGKIARGPDGEQLWETEYDSQLVQFLLKAWAPRVYGDKIQQTIKSEDWSGNLEDLPEELLKQILAKIDAEAAAIKAKQAQESSQQPSAP